jgi:endonuclease YncB( thermonuclease family)
MSPYAPPVSQGRGITCVHCSQTQCLSTLYAKCQNREKACHYYQVPSVKPRLITVLLWLALAPGALADTITGRVVAIADGDTITILDAKRNQRKIRLSGIDAPESEQPYGTLSQQNLGELIFSKQVIVEYDEQDRYGRILGKVLFNRQNAT